MVEEKFDGNVHYYFLMTIKTYCLIMLFVLHCLNYTSAHQVDNPPSVAIGCVLGTEGTFVIYSYFMLIIINLYTDTYTCNQQMKI